MGIASRSGDLLERSQHLRTLAERLGAVRQTSRGQLVFIAGEAGIGKSALLRAFCAEHADAARILWGSCDPLFTPRPLGPFLDIAESTKGELKSLVETGAKPHEVASLLTRELSTGTPAIVVLDDLNWADEATLDVLRLLSRRIDHIPALVLAAYRDDELDRKHPLRLVLGELGSGETAIRLKLGRLTPEAVAVLAAAENVDAESLYLKTGGNPFFVTEALAAKQDEIPDTVRDAVLARAARLSEPAARILEAVAVVPPQADLRLLDSLVGDAVEHLEECLSSGMLTSVAGGVAFRHELARLAVEESLPPNRKLDLHKRALEALRDPPGGAPDLARLAHHAEAAGDEQAVLEFAPAAGARAAEVGAHREAAAQYARALRLSTGLEPEARGKLLENTAYAYYLAGEFDQAIEAQRRALEIHRQIGDASREGDALRSCSRLLRYLGRSEEAMEIGREAVRVLEQLPPSHELGMAYCNLSHLHMHREDADETVGWGARALDVAERLDDPEILVYALTNIGVIELLDGKGSEKVRRSLELAQQAGLEEHAGRAYVALTWWSPRGRSYADASRHLEPGLDYCTERGLDLWRSFLIAFRARSQLDRGDWDDAAESATLVLRDPHASPVPSVTALSVLGLVRARRGDPDVWSPLDEAWVLAEHTGELQRIEPAAAARAEAAWLEGRHELVAASTDLALELAAQRGASWIVGELEFWRWRAGIRAEIPPRVSEPWAAHIAGDWRRAAELWGALESPYEAALARAEAEEEQVVRRALAELRQLGADQAAKIVEQRLRQRGARSLPRGPRAATRQNPAGLTTRQIEVLRLLAEGLRNAEIAERLFVAEKTVDHHVSAILRKLGVRTRTQASAEAGRLGISAQDR